MHLTLVQQTTNPKEEMSPDQSCPLQHQVLSAMKRKISQKVNLHLHLQKKSNLLDLHQIQSHEIKWAFLSSAYVLVIIQGITLDSLLRGKLNFTYISQLVCTKIAKAGPGFDDQPEHSFVQINSSSPCIITSQKSCLIRLNQKFVCLL